MITLTITLNDGQPFKRQFESQAWAEQYLALLIQSGVNYKVIDHEVNNGIPETKNDQVGSWG